MVRKVNFLHSSTCFIQISYFHFGYFYLFGALGINSRNDKVFERHGGIPVRVRWWLPLSVAHHSMLPRSTLHFVEKVEHRVIIIPYTDT